MGLFMWLGRKSGFGGFIVLAILCSFFGIGAMLYAAHRERAYGDRSESLSRRETVITLAVVILWVGFVLYRAVQR
jgi:Na+/H+ antiporter NhaC